MSQHTASVLCADANVVIRILVRVRIQNFRMENPMKESEDKEIKGKILSRIQEQLNKEPGAEGMVYAKADEHHKGGAYQKGPVQIQPEG